MRSAACCLYVCALGLCVPASQDFAVVWLRLTSSRLHFRSFEADTDSAVGGERLAEPLFAGMLIADRPWLLLMNSTSAQKFRTSA